MNNAAPKQLYSFILFEHNNSCLIASTFVNELYLDYTKGNKNIVLDTKMFSLSLDIITRKSSRFPLKLGIIFN